MGLTGKRQDQRLVNDLGIKREVGSVNPFSSGNSRLRVPINGPVVGSYISGILSRFISLSEPDSTTEIWVKPEIGASSIVTTGVAVRLGFEDFDPNFGYFVEIKWDAALNKRFFRSFRLDEGGEENFVVSDEIPFSLSFDEPLGLRISVTDDVSKPQIFAAFNDGGSQGGWTPKVNLVDNNGGAMFDRPGVWNWYVRKESDVPGDTVLFDDFKANNVSAPPVSFTFPLEEDFTDVSWG